MRHKISAALAALLLMANPAMATVTITGKTYTYTNGSPNDASQVDTEFTNAFNNDSAIKTKVDNLLNGQIEDGTSVLVNSLYTGSSPGNMSYCVERGTLANTCLRWTESNSRWELTNDGSSYGAISTGTMATQSEMETGTSTTVHVTPGRQQYHPLMAKAWVFFNGTGTITINASSGVTSLTDNGTGDYTVNFTTAFSSANYLASCHADNAGSTSFETVQTTRATGSYRFVVRRTSDFAAFDVANIDCVFYGDQ